VTITVLLADDQALLRGTFTLLLASVPDIEVVGEAATGHEAVELARSLRPQVVVMDIRMPGMDGVEATRRITTNPALPDTRVLVLTTFETDEIIAAALRAGASGFLGKGVEPGNLIEAIRTTAAGEALLSPAATTALIGRLLRQAEPNRPDPNPGLADLTDREREIAALVAEGLSNTDIAERLVISPATVKTHVNRAMMKTGARDRAQLVVFAYQGGLVDDRRPGQ
jgi:DNA-binding NarL/FixJ family response regulator